MGRGVTGGVLQGVVLYFVTHINDFNMTVEGINSKFTNDTLLLKPIQQNLHAETQIIIPGTGNHSDTNIIFVYYRHSVQE